MYHMRRNEKEIKDKKDLIEVIINGKFTTIAMCIESEPYIVTLSYGFDKKTNCLYFHCASEGLKLDFIQKNPRVCCTIIEDKGYIPNECNHAFKSVIIRGSIKIITLIEEKKYGFDVLLSHLEENPNELNNRFFKTDESYESTCILRLDIEEIQGKESS